jgi:hypothetical protein
MVFLLTYLLCLLFLILVYGRSWSGSYGSWIYYLFNQCLSPLKLLVRIPFMVRCTQLIQHYVIKFVSDLRQVGHFLRGLVFSENKTDRHNITEILLKMPLNNISLRQPNRVFVIDGGLSNCHIPFYL